MKAACSELEELESDFVIMDETEREEEECYSREEAQGQYEPDDILVPKNVAHPISFLASSIDMHRRLTCIANFFRLHLGSL